MAVADLTFGREELARPEEDSQRKLIWRRFRKHKLAVAGLGIVIFLFLFAFVVKHIVDGQGGLFGQREKQIEAAFE